MHGCAGSSVLRRLRAWFSIYFQISEKMEKTVAGGENTDAAHTLKVC